MNMKKVCKDTGHFFVGCSVWLAEKTVQGTMVAVNIAVKGTVIAAKAADSMTRKGEQITARQKIRRQARKADKAVALEIREAELANRENLVPAEDTSESVPQCKDTSEI